MSVTESPEVSFVIPLYNEAENLEPLADAIKAVFSGIGRNYEIIFIDDGSTDDSYSVLQRLRESDKSIRLIRFKTNSGQTAALDAGFKAARGEIIAMMDADLQNDPRDVPKMLDLLKEYDAVCGWRKERNDPWLKIVSGKIANFIRNKLSRENIADTGCSLKCFRKEMVTKIKLFHGMHRFLPTLFKMEGYTVAQVEVGHFPRKFGISKYNIRNRILRSFLDLLAVRWMKARNIRYEIIEKD